MKTKKINSNSRTNSERSEADDDSEDEKELAPLLVFLASSLNVELVYIILKCITQFAYVITDNDTDEVAKRKKDKLLLVNNEAKGSATITLSKVKIKNYSDWT